MKKALFILGIATITLLFGCKAGQAKGGEATDSTDTEITNDTLVTEALFFESDEKQFAVDIYIDMPQGESELAKAITKFAYADIDTMTGERMSGNPDKVFVSQRNKAGKGQDMVNFFGKYNIEELKRCRVDMEDGDDRMYGYSYRLTKAKETHQFVIYTRSTYVNLGGAHGYSGEINFIFVKPTGKLIKEVFEKSKEEEMQSLLRKGIVDYIRESGWDVEEDNLMSVLMLGDSPIIPLPLNSPLIEGDSLRLSYQPYEIAPYAMGMPSFSVSIKDAEPFLTEDAKKILITK